jgi:glutamine synthetase
MSIEELLEYVEEEDVRFIRLTFFDVYGAQKNISILPDQLEKALRKGMPVESSGIAGFDQDQTLYLRPDLSTCMILPWRSLQGSVILLMCDILHEDGTPYDRDTRALLKKSADKIKAEGIGLEMSAQFEFYLFDEATGLPLDNGGYLDVAPLDKGEDIRRQICMTLEQMGLQPQASFHQAGPGQNEIDFHASDPLTSADEASVFKWAVRTLASQHGCTADFSPKPLTNKPGNGMHLRVHVEDKKDFDRFYAGVLSHLDEMAFVANPDKDSYKRLADVDAEKLVKSNGKDMFEIRLPDCMANPYLLWTLIIEAGLSFDKEPSSFQLSKNRQQAVQKGKDSAFVSACIPQGIFEALLQCGK